MYKFIILVCLALITPFAVSAFGTGAGTCDVVANYSTITGMGSRTRNPNQGPYLVESNMGNYTFGTPVELTVTGPAFTGIMFSVVDDKGTRVGSFDTNVNAIQNCSGTVSVTHTIQFGSMTSHTLFWIPPEGDVGTVYVLGYVLSGSRGNQGAQQFYRFVRDDSSAISIEPAAAAETPIFKDGFEASIF